MTSYTFDVLGDMTGVSQSAQPNGTAQSRSYSFDGLSRLTSETNPESGATNYTYDSATGCTGTYSGDQVKRVDAVGNTTCLAYDLLHRVTSITYPSGPYAASTPAKTLVYDTATVNGVPMTNVKTRLAEAYTGPVGAKITDLGFSYTDRGQISDVYQSTPHSSGYYHLNQTYWPHGGPSQLSQLSGLPTISYGGTIGSTLGLDGEGRITQVTASSGPNPVTGASYNTSNQPTQVTLASGDSDIFAYDPNTLRTTQYKFNVGTQSQSVTGTLTWNANATLAQLAITDQFNSADTQTCNYAHDDLTRIASANCGSAAAQTFSYDPFGNISKSGSPNTFQPTYNAATNRFATIPGTTPSYDANGNVLSDGSHNYAWDADGNSVTLDGVGLTFDALDRMVEQNRSGTYTQIVYAPTGVKLALTSGQTLQKAFVLLPGQATAVYTSTGLDHYRHSDWLGSARLTSSPSRTVLSTAAYAPFGETYAQSGTADLSFTGQNSDTTSGDYDFLFREYSTQGRWTSPDPAGFASVDPSNPQSWNGYAYVTNNPLRLTDPLGLCGQPGETANGPYNYYGGGPCLPLLPPLLGYPCFGFLGVWHSGCPPRAAMPPQAPQKPKSPRQKCLDDTASIDAFLKDVAKARKENLKEGGKRILQAYAFTSIVGCVAGATATGGLGCIPGAKTADAVATPLILSGEALWFLVDQGYDTLKAAIKNTKRAIACNKLTD